MSISKACEVCGKEFQATKRKAKVCSLKCRGILAAKIRTVGGSVVKVCAVCGNEFKIPKCREDSAKTCSQKCRGVLIAKAYEENRIEYQCKWCGKSFKAPPGQIGRVHCSYECAHNAHRGVSTGRTTPDGATTLHSDGYVLERALHHPFNVAGYVLQHRLVAEEWMREAAPDHSFLTEIDGVKYLRRNIDVHHRSEVKDDNRRENLMACTPATHRDIHDGRSLMCGTVWPESGNEIESVPRRVTLACMECGKQIERKLSDVKRGNGKFCSRACSGAWYGRQRKTKVVRQCMQCGAEFDVWPATIAKGSGKFCSNACRHKYRIGRNPKDVIPY